MQNICRSEHSSLLILDEKYLSLSGLNETSLWRLQSWIANEGSDQFIIIAYFPFTLYILQLCCFVDLMYLLCFWNIAQCFLLWARIKVFRTSLFVEDVEKPMHRSRVQNWRANYVLRTPGRKRTSGKRSYGPKVGRPLNVTSECDVLWTTLAEWEPRNG